jgi:hypothetical protein
MTSLSRPETFRPQTLVWERASLGSSASSRRQRSIQSNLHTTRSGRPHREHWTITVAIATRFARLRLMIKVAP